MISCLIAAIESDDERNFMEKLYIKHHAAMCARARSILRSRADAEDAVQSAFVRLIARAGELKGREPAALRSYLMVCARNAALDRLRRQSKSYGFGDAQARIETCPRRANCPKHGWSCSPSCASFRIRLRRRNTACAARWRRAIRHWRKNSSQRSANPSSGARQAARPQTLTIPIFAR